MSNHEECARLLIEGSKHTELTDYLTLYLMEMRGLGHLGTVRLPLEKGVDPGVENSNAQSMPMLATDKTERLQALQEHGASIRPEILLHTAIMNGHETILRLSLRLGADPSSTKYAGHTAYYKALIYSRFRFLKVLLKHHAERQMTRNFDGDIALHFAAHIAGSCF